MLRDPRAVAPETTVAEARETFENPRVRLLLVARRRAVPRRGHARARRAGGRRRRRRSGELRGRRRAARRSRGSRQPRGRAARRRRSDGPAAGGRRRRHAARAWCASTAATGHFCVDGRDRRPRFEPSGRGWPWRRRAGVRRCGGDETSCAHRDFRNLFIGQAASTIGDRIVFVALALYVTRDRLADRRRASCSRRRRSRSSRSC